jgi:hypothetical protein
LHDWRHDFYEAPLFIKLQGAWGHVAHPVVMESLGVTSGHPEQTRDGVFDDADEPRLSVPRILRLNGS